MRRTFLITALGLALLGLALGRAKATDEEKEVGAAIGSYTAAFNQGDLDRILAHFATDADYVDENGKQFKGKVSLAEVLKQSLANLKGQQIKTSVTSLRFLRPDVAIVDGKADIITPDGPSDLGRFTAIWTKTGSQWLLTSVHDLRESTADADSVLPQLKELEWLVGDWASDDPKFSVQVSGRWALNKSFLLLQYTVKGQEGNDLAVDQYFGWDPVEGVIRSWFFDSQGGYGGGDWDRQGNTWSAYWSGVLSEGRTGSSTSSLKFIDEKSFLFRSTERQIDDQPLPDVEAKFIRKNASK
jgi:uncharacterized protein (TIGR02246 family)